MYTFNICDFQILNEKLNRDNELEEKFNECLDDASSALMFFSDDCATLFFNFEAGKKMDDFLQKQCNFYIYKVEENQFTYKIKSIKENIKMPVLRFF